MNLNRDHFKGRMIYQASSAKDTRWRHYAVAGLTIIIAFFFLPLFLRWQATGMAVWLGITIVTLTLLAAHFRPGTYCLTDSEVIKLHPSSGNIIWSVKIRQIINVRLRGATIILKIPKKNYLIYNISHTNDFIERLNNQRAQLND